MFLCYRMVAQGLFCDTICLIWLLIRVIACGKKPLSLKENLKEYSTDLVLHFYGIVGVGDREIKECSKIDAAEPERHILLWYWPPVATVIHTCSMPAITVTTLFYFHYVTFIVVNSSFHCLKQMFRKERPVLKTYKQHKCQNLFSVWIMLQSVFSKLIIQSPFNGVYFNKKLPLIQDKSKNKQWFFFYVVHHNISEYNTYILSLTS